MELPQITLFDILVGSGLFAIFIIIFLLGVMIKHKVRIVFFSLAALLFLALPFLNLLIIDGYINKVEFSNIDSKKLVYMPSYLINGEISNHGKRVLKQCELNVYVNRKFPLSPEYKVILSDLELKVGQKAPVLKTIDDFKADNIRYIKLRCS